MYMIETMIFNGLILILIMFSISSVKQNNIPWIESVNSYRGLMALLIVAGHVSNMMAGGAPYDLIARFAYVIVGYFFFVSGLGNAVKYSDGGPTGFFADYWERKVIYLIVLAIVTWGFYLLGQWILKVQVFNTYSDNLLLNFCNDTNWYIWELLALYILLWACLRLFGEKGKWILLVIVIAGVAVIYVLKGPSVYYKSAVAFPIGVLVGMNVKKNTVMSKQNIILLAGIVVAGGGFALSGIPLLRQVYMSNVICIIGIAIVTIAAHFFAITGKLLAFCKKISTEIYLIQFLWLKTLGRFTESFELRLITVLICTLGSACVLSFITNPIKRLLRKRG